jgi:hypothetical protein
MTDEHDLIHSPLQRTFSSDGETVEIAIYRLPNTGWTLEVVDRFNNSTVWNGEFATDQAALDEFMKDLAAEGIHALVGIDPKAKIH